MESGQTEVMLLSAKTSKKPVWSRGRRESDFTCFTSFFFLLKLELTVLANIKSSSAPAENISLGIKIVNCLNYMFTWNRFLFPFLNIIIFARMFADHSCCIHVYADECVCMIALPLCTSVCALTVNSFPFRLERSCNRQGKGSETKYSRLKVRRSSLMLTTTWAESMQRRRTKTWNKFTAQPSDVSEMKWCSLLRWNMTARVPSCISCLAQEEPIWSWALDVLCCCVACCCNGSSHFCWCF